MRGRWLLLGVGAGFGAYGGWVCGFVVASAFMLAGSEVPPPGGPSPAPWGLLWMPVGAALGAAVIAALSALVQAVAAVRAGERRDTPNNSSSDRACK